MEAEGELLKFSREDGSPIEIKEGEGSFVKKLHSHLEVSLGYIKRGETIVSVDKRELRLTPGDLILIPPGRVHLCKPVSGSDFKFIMIYIDHKWITNLLNINFNTIETLVCPGDFSVEDFINKSDDPVNLIEELITNYIDLTPRYMTLPSLDIIDIKNYIDKNYFLPISLDDLSQIFSINKYSLIRGFKKYFHLSPRSYIINLRVNMSKKLLKSGLAMADIAMECGFYDQSHFIKSFKTYTGITPDSYK